MRIGAKQARVSLITGSQDGSKGEAWLNGLFQYDMGGKHFLEVADAAGPAERSRAITAALSRYKALPKRYRVGSKLQLVTFRGVREVRVSALDAAHFGHNLYVLPVLETTSGPRLGGSPAGVPGINVDGFDGEAGLLTESGNVSPKARLIKPLRGKALSKAARKRLHGQLQAAEKGRADALGALRSAPGLTGDKVTVAVYKGRFAKPEIVLARVQIAVDKASNPDAEGPYDALVVLNRKNGKMLGRLQPSGTYAKLRVLAYLDSGAGGAWGVLYSDHTVFGFEGVTLLTFGVSGKVKTTPLHWEMGG